MFTLQSGQIENALRTVGIPDVSAREMMSGMANCQAVLEHRGPVALTKPTINYFPTIRPAGPSTSFRYSPVTSNTFVDIPPWQNIPFTPLPFLPVPPWENIPYPQWPTTPLEEPVLEASGPVSTGPISAPAANITNLTTQHITNEGDIINQGDVINQGDITTENMTVNNSLTVQNNVTNNGPVTNNSTVYNNGDTYNNVAHNQYTINYGPTHHHGETHFDGPNKFNGPNVLRGPTFVENNIYVNGTPLEITKLEVVTDVSWVGGVLSQTKREINVFGSQGTPATSVVLDCSG